MRALTCFVFHRFLLQSLLILKIFNFSYTSYYVWGFLLTHAQCNNQLGARTPGPDCCVKKIFFKNKKIYAPNCMTFLSLYFTPRKINSGTVVKIVSRTVPDKVRTTFNMYVFSFAYSLRRLTGWQYLERSTFTQTDGLAGQ